jgi:hypothetical protein
MGQVAVPRFQHALHPNGVVGVPRDSSPVHVPNDDTAARRHDAAQLAQSTRHVLHVFEDLNAQCSVKLGVG